MSTILKPYPKYRGSGLPWLGEIPEHWDLLRTKYVFREVDERSTTGEETHLSMSQKYGLVESSRIDEWRLQSESYVGGKLCKTNDLVLNRLKAHLGVFAHAPVDGVVSPDYTVLRVVRDSEPRFLENVFKTPTYIGELRRSTKGIVKGFWRLYTDDLYDIRVPVPPAREQRTILDWIDRFDHMVQRLILAKQHLIELLNEQKQAIIHRAVTRGFDPDTRTKLTGLDWLPEVPHHWEVRRLKHLVSNINDQTATRRDDEIYVALEHIESWTGKISLPAEAPEFDSQVKRFQPGDVLFGKLRPYLAKVARPQRRGVGVGELLVLRSRDASIMPEYLEQKLRSRQIIDLINSSTFGAKMPRADWTFVGSVEIAFPPSYEEQRAILDHIASETKTIDSAMQRTRREINLVREYRTRLISDAVTGKLDVRGVDLPEPEESGAVSGLDGSEDDGTENLVTEAEEVPVADL